jgi:hypothetical protein
VRLERIAILHIKRYFAPTELGLEARVRVRIRVRIRGEGQDK